MPEDEKVYEWGLCAAGTTSIEVVVLNTADDHSFQRRVRASWCSPRVRSWTRVSIPPIRPGSAHTFEGVDRQYGLQRNLWSTRTRKSAPPGYSRTVGSTTGTQRRSILAQDWRGGESGGFVHQSVTYTPQSSNSPTTTWLSISRRSTSGRAGTEGHPRQVAHFEDAINTWVVRRRRRVAS